MACKIVFIGGGSVIWTPTFVNDLFQQKNLMGSQLTLVDIEPHALSLMEAYCKRLSKQYEAGWTIESASLEDALHGADYVCVSISTGGFEAMHHDYTIPEKYGVFHTVGDTVGPAGISRTLRNVPVFVDIAQKMEKICPDAWMIHVTNPLSQLTRAVNLTSNIKCVGLCHNYAGTLSMLANMLDTDEDLIHAVSVGVNHYSYMKDITVAGKPVGPEFSLAAYIQYHLKSKGKPLLTGTTDDIVQQMTGYEGTMEYYLNFALYEQFGVFPVGGSNHVAENLPFYCNSLETQKKYHIRRKGVLPRRQEQKDEKQCRIEKMLQQQEKLPMEKASKESFSAIVGALETGKPVRTIVAMANQGQISNLADGLIVETWAEVNGSGIFPLQSGDMPAPLLGWMQMTIDEQEASVRAAIDGDYKVALSAMMISPMLADKDQAKPLLDELLDANQAYVAHIKR